MKLSVTKAQHRAHELRNRGQCYQNGDDIRLPTCKILSSLQFSPSLG